MPVRERSSAPHMSVLYSKAAGGLGLAGLRRLPVLGGEERERELPDTELLLRDVEVDSERLARYQRVCTFELRDELPVTYPHVLAFPLAMELMTDGAFPFQVVGLIHIGNRIEQRRPIGVEERLDLRVRAERLAEHARGTQFEMVAEVEAGGEAVWRSASTYLHREPGGSSEGRSRDQADEPPRPVAEWNVPADAGRRYAAVSGDVNPIHLHPLSARLFGQRGPIAHGMWLKARCLAVLGDVLPGAATVDVSFKLPVALPSRVALSSWNDGAARRFQLSEATSGKPHLAGEITAR